MIPEIKCLHLICWIGTVMSSSEEKRSFLSKLSGPEGRGALNFAVELSDCPTLFWQLHYRQTK